MNKIILALALMSSSMALAEVPPPGTARKGPIVVTPEGMGSHEYDLKDYAVVKRGAKPTIQQRLDGLRRKVKELEKELAQRPYLPVTIPVATPKRNVTVVREKSESRNRIALYAGIAPDGIHLDAKDKERKAQLHETGTALGLSYGYRFSDNWSVNAFGSVTTRSTHIPSGFLGIGRDF